MTSSHFSPHVILASCSTRTCLWDGIQYRDLPMGRHSIQVPPYWTEFSTGTFQWDGIQYRTSLWDGIQYMDLYVTAFCTWTSRCDGILGYVRHGLVCAAWAGVCITVWCVRHGWVCAARSDVCGTGGCGKARLIHTSFSAHYSLKVDT